MKTLRRVSLIALSFLALGSTAQAGIRGGFYVGAGYGCGPRYYAPPVCAVPRVVYAGPRVIYCPPASVYYAAAPVVFGPVARPVCRAPLAAPPVVVSNVAFGWRR